MNSILVRFFEKGRNASALALGRQGFFNVNPEEEPSLFWWIVAFKCWLAAYATSQIYYQCLNFMVMFGAYMHMIKIGDPWGFPVIAFNIALLSDYDLRNWLFTVTLVYWSLISVIADFQLLMDVFIAVAIVKHHIDMYSQAEVAFLPLTVAMYWWIDKYLGPYSLNLIEACCPLLILALLYYFLRPNYTWLYSMEPYYQACFLVYMVMLLKFYRIWSAHGFHESPLFFPYERYEHKLNLVHYYLFSATEREQSIILDYILYSLIMPDRKMHPLINDLLFNLTEAEILPPIPSVAM